MTTLTGVSLALLWGLAAAGQARINGELGRRLHDGFAAAVISFGSGLIILLLISPWMRRGLASVRQSLRDGTLKPWQCFGGACGAFLVATQGLTVATIGVALFTVAVVAGQSASSLIVDRVGIVPGGSRPITLNRLLGAFLCVVAVVVAVSNRLDSTSVLALAALPLLAGISIAWQQGVNGLVRQAAGSVWPATLINFFVGTCVLVPVFLIEMIFRGPPASLPHEWWLYTGGSIGIIFIAMAAGVVQHIGVLLLGLGTIAGQIIGALLLDTFAPAAGSPSLLTYAGAAIALFAVALAALPTRHPTHPPDPPLQ